MRILAIVLMINALQCAARQVWVPVVDSAWWQITEKSPDVAPFNNYPTHEAVDFTIFQTATGSWRLIACVRYTTYPGSTRLLHAWEAGNLTDTMWASARIPNTFVTNGVTVNVTNGIFAVSNTQPPLNQTEGRMQAPHCVTYNGRYYCFYNSNGAYCKISDDGLMFTDATNTAGSYKFFDMGRDVMVYNPFSNVWVAYFENGGVMASRTAPAPQGPWSATAVPVRTVGNPESPFAVSYAGTHYFWQQLSVIESTNYLNFEGPKVTYMSPTWFDGKYAPEVVYHNGQWYIAGYSSGIWLARMRWELREVTDADLVFLETSGATLSPAFFQTTTWYTASAPYSLTASMQTYHEADERASILINGVPSLGSRSNTVDLTVGANLIEFDITAQSGARKRYTIHLTRAANTSVQRPQLSASDVWVPEGGTNTLGVRLAFEPAGVVTMTVMRVYGDTDISVMSHSNLIFTAANYSVYQTVVVAAPYDLDRESGAALIQCAAPGMDSVNVLVRELDERAGIPIPVDCDFGPLPSTGTWNNLPQHAAGTVYSNLVTRQGAPADIAVQLGGAFSHAFTNGVAQGVYPASAQQDGFAVAPGATGILTITGLNHAHTYDVTLFGSAVVEQHDYRAAYEAGGAAALLDTFNNADNAVTLERVAPDGAGVVAVGVSRAGQAADDRAALNALVLQQRPSGGTLLFDFGPTLTPGNWNNVTSTNEGAGVINAVDINGQATGVDLVITDAFHQSNANEGLNTNTLYPATAQFDCLRTFTSGDRAAGFQVRGLNPLQQYELRFYGAAWRSGTRGSDYTVQGVTRTLLATDNFNNQCVFSNVAPDSAGVINVGVRAMSGASWSYLNVLEIRPAAAVPARTFLFDCGVPELTTPGAWNNLTNAGMGLALQQIVDTNGVSADITVEISNQFEYAALCGVNASNVVPATAQHDGFVLGSTHSNAWLVVQGLDSNALYDVTCFGSYAVDLPERRTRFAVNGQSVVLDARNNAAGVAWLPALTAQAGHITLQITSAGTNAADFGCVNVMTVEMIVPEGSTLIVPVCVCTAFAVRARRFFYSPLRRRIEVGRDLSDG